MKTTLRELAHKHLIVGVDISSYNSKLEKLIHNETLGQPKVTKNLVIKEFLKYKHS